MLSQYLGMIIKLSLITNIYLLYGEETFLLETCLKKIKNQFDKLIPGINYIKIESKAIQSQSSHQ